VKSQGNKKKRSEGKKQGSLGERILAVSYQAGTKKKKNAVCRRTRQKKRWGKKGNARKINHNKGEI